MPESGTYQLPPKSLKWESGQDGRYQTVYLPVTILETGKISWSFWPTEKAGRAVGRDSQIFACQLARCRSAEDAVLCHSDMMLCDISYWVLSGAKWRQIQQLRCCVLPGTQGSAGHERIRCPSVGYRVGQVSQDHADYRYSLAGKAAETGSPAEVQGAGQGESTGFRSATAEPLAGRTGVAESICTAYRRKIRKLFSIIVRGDVY